MLTRYNIDTKEQRVYIEYVSNLLTCVEDDVFEDIRCLLERKFDAQRLADLRLQACGIVHMRDDMDDRMRKYREQNATKCKADRMEMNSKIVDELRTKYNKEVSPMHMTTEDFIVFAYKEGLRNAGAKIRNYLTPMLTLAEMELKGADKDIKEECAKQILINIEKIRNIDDVSETI